MKRMLMGGWRRQVLDASTQADPLAVSHVKTRAMPIHHAIGLAILVLTFAACGSSAPLPTVPDGALDAPSGPPPNASSAASAAPPVSKAPAAPAASGSFECRGPQPGYGLLTVSYDKSCEHDDDCAWGKYPECCFGDHAVGARKGQEGKIANSCDCPPALCALMGGLVAEDGGKSSAPGAKDVLVSCVDKTCKTRIKK
jgi:hypothetical protein